MDEALLRRVVEGGMRAFGVPGLAVAVTDRERTLWTAAYGLGDIAAAKPVGPETLFQIGSISKSVAVLAVLQQVDQGRLDLDAPVTDYLPWFRLRAGTEGVTLHRLLSHTAGLVPGMDATPSTLGEALALARTEAAAGSGFRYSNAGYAVVGLVLEHATGLPVADALAQAVLAPAGMASSETVVTNALRSRSAVGYEPLDDSIPWRPGLPLAPAPWAETDSAAGSISSTAGDMAAYARLLLRRGRGVVSDESFTRMITSASDPDEKGWGYGYGMAVQPAARLLIGHNGSSPGFTASLDVDMTAGLGVIVLCNLTDLRTFAPAPIGEALSAIAVAHVEDLEPPEAPTWPQPEPVTETDEGDIPSSWRAYLGHYRSHSPWAPGFIVLTRDGALHLRLPTFEEIALTPLAEGTFGVSHDVEGPATVEFGDVIDGKAARATCDGVDLYRVGW
jgi:CubicO group peptidase (beta-lactamase class C family)